MAIEDPELPPKEGSEIEAAVDVSISMSGLDGVPRPFFICQETDVLQITLKDAKRLRDFLDKGIKFVEEFNGRSTH